MYQIDFFRNSAFLSLLAWGLFSCSLGRGVRRLPACTLQRKFGPRPRSMGRALDLQSREFWQITKGRRSDLTRLNTASRLSCEICRRSPRAQRHEGITHTAAHSRHCSLCCVRCCVQGSMLLCVDSVHNTGWHFWVLFWCSFGGIFIANTANCKPEIIWPFSSLMEKLVFFFRKRSE